MVPEMGPPSWQRTQHKNLFEIPPLGVNSFPSALTWQYVDNWPRPESRLSPDTDSPGSDRGNRAHAFRPAVRRSRALQPVLFVLLFTPSRLLGELSADEPDYCRPGLSALLLFGAFIRSWSVLARLKRSSAAIDAILATPIAGRVSMGQYLGVSDRW